MSGSRRRPIALVTLGWLALALSGEAQAEEILRSILDQPILFQYSSQHDVLQLEECFSIALSQVGVPTSIHGKEHTIISAWPQSSMSNKLVAVAVTLTPSVGRVLVEVRTKGAGRLGNTYYNSAQRAAEECR